MDENKKPGIATLAFQKQLDAFRYATEFQAEFCRNQIIEAAEQYAEQQREAGRQEGQAEIGLMCAPYVDALAAKDRIDCLRVTNAQQTERIEELEAQLAEVYAAFHIGQQARTPATLMENLRNTMRRTDCLDAIEREFFMAEVPPDADEGDTEPGEECMMRWGVGPREYVEQFRAALAQLAARPAVDLTHMGDCSKCKAIGAAYKIGKGAGVEKALSQDKPAATSQKIDCDACNGTGGIQIDDGYPGDGMLVPPDPPTIERCADCEGTGKGYPGELIAPAPTASDALPPLPWKDEKYGGNYIEWSAQTESMGDAFHAYARAAVAADRAGRGVPDIGAMVNRFLVWQLPQDFRPDGGISFTAPEPSLFWPIGTHLFTADQARAMFEYCLEGATSAPVANTFDAEWTKFTAARLRVVLNMLGITDPFPDNDASLCGVIGTVLGDVRRTLEQHAPVAGGDERGWCLELGPASSPKYLFVEAGVFAWTYDNLKALRLSRRADAEQIALIVEDADRIAEHMWMAPAALTQQKGGSNE